MAVVYFDSSAFAKLLISEPDSDLAEEAWDAADSVVAGRLSYAEVRAALAAAWRDRRISTRRLDVAKRSWEAFWSESRIVEPSPALVDAAGELAETFALRGYDAVHLASALTIAAEGVVVLTWDQRLRRCVRAAGLALAPARA